MDSDEVRSWKAVTLKEEEYIIRIAIVESSYRLQISDLQVVYEEYVGEEELQEKCKVINPGLEISSSRILSQIEKILNDVIERKNTRTTLSIMEKTEDFLELKAESMLIEIPFIWCFSLSVTDYSQVLQHITKPVICMVAEMQRRQKHLFGIIKKKDAEIEDYKMGGAKVSRAYLETQPFSEANFYADVTNKSEDILDAVKNSLKQVFCKDNNDLYSLMITTSKVLSDRRKCLETCEGGSTTDVHQDDSHKIAASKESLELSNKEKEIQRRRELEIQLAEAKERKKATKKKKLNL